MALFNFKNKTDEEIEEEIVNEVIAENESSETSNIKVIQYFINDIEDSVPTIKLICMLHYDRIPEIGSIIWCPNIELRSLIPYKVIRYDYIEDVDSEANKYNYVVVKEATTQDIL